MPEHLAVVLVEIFHAGVHIDIVEWNAASEYSAFSVVDVAACSGDSVGGAAAVGLAHFLPFVILYGLEIDYLGYHDAEHQHYQSEDSGKNDDGFFNVFAHSCGVG